MGIKGILFDAADVFYKRKESTEKYVQRLIQSRGHPIRLSPADEEHRQEMRHLANGGHISAVEFWDKVLTMHGIAAADERMVCVKQILAHANQVLALPGGHETVKALKGRGFLLGIVTDTMYPLEWKMNWLSQVGVAEFIDVVACSTELGVHKPDPAIYLDAVRKSGLAVAESAFVGHDAGELKGARAVGLATVAVLYDPHAQADYYAETLPDLLNVPIFQQAG